MVWQHFNRSAVSCCLRSAPGSAGLTGPLWLIHQQTQLLQPGLPPRHWGCRVGCPYFQGFDSSSNSWWDWYLFSKPCPAGHSTASIGPALRTDGTSLMWNGFWLFMGFVFPVWRIYYKQFLQKLRLMKISILCTVIWKRWWGETKQNISWFLSFSPDLPFCFVFFFNWKLRGDASTFCDWRWAGSPSCIEEVLVHLEHGSGDESLGTLLCMSERVLISINCFPSCFCGLYGEHTAGNTKIELLGLKTHLKHTLLQNENAGLVSSCCLET